MIYSFLEPPLILRLFISRSLLSQHRAIGSKPSIPHHLPLLPKIPRSPLLAAGRHSDAMSRTPPAPQKRRRRGGQKLEEGLFFASLNAPYDVIIDMPPSFCENGIQRLLFYCGMIDLRILRMDNNLSTWQGRRHLPA